MDSFMNFERLNDLRHNGHNGFKNKTLDGLTIRTLQDYQDYEPKFSWSKSTKMTKKRGTYRPRSTKRGIPVDGEVEVEVELRKPAKQEW
jgi:hypothetical protein